MTGFVVTAMLSCSLGFLLGGIVTSSKVRGLYDRLARTEQDLHEQSKLVQELANTTRRLLGVIEGRMINSVGTDALGEAHVSLARCDDFLRTLEKTSSEAA